MNPTLTETLCTQCGLCCDGTLFADVELTGQAELTRLESMGLEVEDDDAGGGLLSQPCAALRGRRCVIYAHRPKCCRTFECGLLQDVQAGTMSVEGASVHVAEALRQIERAKTLLLELGQRDLRLPLKERAAEALVGAVGDSPEQTQRRARLAAAMSGLERLIRDRFLSRKG
jgi:uncharacterized protein